ncbi:MAG TPA: SprB repeat-containing protein, partial [Chitinophagales bacterium]|nr:SprB repeat-containing protein [Chitinophagales bacterium]
MKRYTKVFLYFSAFVYINIASAQTFNDGPMELQVRITEVRVDYHPTSNQSDDFNLSGSIGGAIAGIVNVNIPSLEVDEITAKVWARANPDLLSNGWQGGGCMPGDLPMSAGGPEVYLVDPSVQNIFNTNFPGPQVPQFFDLKLQAWEDEKSGDFDQLPSSLLIVTNDCQTNDGYSRCTYDGTNTCCLSASLFGCLFSERDDNFCDADPFQVNLDYRAAGPPCRWNNHGFIAGNCPSNNFYQVRVESFYRFTSGLDCSSAIDLGTLTSGVTLNHFNSNECYSNNLPNSPGNDVFYKFTINSPIGVNVSVCGTSTTFDTYVYLLDNNCNVYDSNDDGCGTQSLIQKSLCRTGVYYVVVDGKNANSTGTFRLTIDENPSFTFAASTVKTNPSCNGYNDGAAEVNVTGGQPQFTYLWSNGSTDTLNTGLIAGTYTVTVTDANGCTLQTSATLVDPAPITVSVTTTDLSCSGANDGSATAAVSGGTFPYNYAWNSTPPQVGSTAVLLPAGTYNVTVADFNGCTATGTGTVSATNPIIITVIDSSDISCFGANDGAITISVSGGQSPYSYNWSNGAPSSPSVSGLSPGPIDVVVIDNTGTCNEKMSFFTFEPAPLVSVVNATRNVSCNGWSDGAIDLGVTGGTLPYTYQWSAGAISEDLLSTSAGPFSVTVTDANGCT